ncbi:Oxidoreductase [Neolecta irregularis DAH-3]|uniref:Oxidoreductase n=1 Tax=Neolecta irregularis (strain DAH-3) TaxID=1198029 RepID=A0A1U7LVM3_NEOID|nr:Oxidoreductase [Neolecta irregularis DAH-3]|eukprot:OLL26725.1 Oxidoreductase [Neolecta irregularis DAH-3]
MWRSSRLFSTMSKFLIPKATPSLNVKGAFSHSKDISLETTKILSDLLERDFKEHSILINKIGLHSHLSHHLLACYSFGVPSKRLAEIYEVDKKDHKLPRGKFHQDFKWGDKITFNNYDYYPDLANFFAQQAEKLGSIAAVEKYVFGDEHDMFKRFMSGAYHCLIHIGYGIEFDLPIMVVEGLAETALHKPTVGALYPDDISKLSLENENLTTEEIVRQVVDDKRFDNMLSFSDSPKLNVVMKNPDLVLEYASKWSVDETNLEEKANELIHLAVVVFAGAQRPDKDLNLDFFLMHTLTSSLFLPSYINALSKKNAVKLLKAKFALDLAYWVSRGRPSIDLTVAEKMGAKYSWDEIIKIGNESRDDHVPKVVRAAKFAEVRCGDKEGIYRGIAAMTVVKITVEGGRYNQDGVGFDECWQDIPARKY